MIRIATAPVSHRGNTLVARRSYQYDTLGRPTSRTLARQGATRNDAFTYNDRSESPRRLVGGLDKTADGVRRVSLWCSYSPAKQGEGTMGCARSKPRSAFAPRGRAGNGVPASQLISDIVDGTALNGWDYDNIGNRRMEHRSDGYEIYTANQLNQYTAIEDQEGTFQPTYDDDGNQTRIKTSTGIWNVTYNAKNLAAAASSSGVASRPVLFTKDDNSVSVACTYDYMGRRATKVVTENGQISSSHRFLYRGYLQIACCDRKRSTHPCLWLITWESPRGLGGGLDKPRSAFAPQGRAGNGVPASQPTQPIATRPLAIQKDSTWYTYGWDLTKNVWEVYGTTGYIGTAYTYTAYGQVTANGSITQPIQWSSEYNDTELALVYYNYRHYNPIDGRWIGRDRIRYWDYVYARNSPCHFSDYNGLYEKDSDNINCIGYCNDKTHNLQPKESSLKETMEGEGWTCIPSKRGDDCSSEDTHTHDIMALFIYVKEVGHKMRRQQKQTKLSDPNDIESKPIELIQDFYEIEKLKPNNANFWSVAKDILDEYGITNMYDAKNIWDWNFESIPRYAAIKEQLKLNQIMDFDYHGVLKESPNNWSYVSCMQPKDHYKVEEAPNLRFFENEEMIEKYCCYRKKGNCK